MSKTVIAVEDLSKRYLIEHTPDAQGYKRYTALRDVIGDEVGNFARKTLAAVRGRQVFQAREVEEFWALKDVSFEVKQGEVVGVIGRNGAGKSTLLKILSRVTEPTRGRVVLRGRVASLLEVGTGFNPELTGRENVYLNGAILGMTRREINEKFDEIVAFAEVEKFLDTPVKRYSSGMYVRLAFAVAAHLEPEILVVDEVLAVGDVNFQKKCLGKMDEISRCGGRTVLFVSHNMSSIIKLTTRAVVLSNGGVDYLGESRSAVQRYMTGDSKQSIIDFDTRNKNRQYKGTGEAIITFLRFNRITPHFKFNEPISYCVEVQAVNNIPCIRAAMTVYRKDGAPVGNSFSPEITGLASGERYEMDVRLPPCRLAPGSYYCAVSIGRGDNLRGLVDYDIITDTLFFDVMPEENEFGALGEWNPGWGAICFEGLYAAWAHRAPALPSSMLSFR